MLEKIGNAIKDKNKSAVLLLLACFIFVFILPAIEFTSNMLSICLFSLIIFLASYPISRKVIFIGFVAILIELATRATDLIYVHYLAELTTNLFIIFLVGSVIKHIMNQKNVSIYTLVNALNGYLLLGINDLLTAFWFARRGKHHGKHHFTGGFAAMFPTASDKTLGSGKFSLGPSFDYEFESGRWFAGAIALQVWSVAGPSDLKAVNMLMIKPFVVFNVVKRFDLIYMPYGISVYWNKPAGEKVYLPLGGGGQYQIPLGKKTTLNLGAQFFKNVIRPTKGTVYDLRFLVEFVF